MGRDNVDMSQAAHAMSSDMPVTITSWKHPARAGMDASDTQLLLLQGAGGSGQWPRGLGALKSQHTQAKRDCEPRTNILRMQKRRTEQ